MCSLEIIDDHICRNNIVSSKAGKCISMSVHKMLNPHFCMIRFTDHHPSNKNANTWRESMRTNRVQSTTDTVKPL